MWFFNILFSAIRYGAAIYGLTLEYFYPFNSLPFAISISDELKESLKYQTEIVSYFSAVSSVAFLSLFFYFMAILIAIRGAIHLVMRCRPAFREKVEKRLAEKALKTQNKKKPSKRAVWSNIIFNILFSTVMIINDAIFNRLEDVISLKEGAIRRFQYLLHRIMPTIYMHLAIYTVVFALAILFSAVLRAYRKRRQQRAAAEEESRLPPSEMAEVETEGQKGVFVLEEKLIDLSDGMDGLYEKMEAYAAPVSADAHDEEPLIQL
jgi:flagellar biosynthesis/type III secretory pathway M-ring protein FliF/YscJ